MGVKPSDFRCKATLQAFSGLIPAGRTQEQPLPPTAGRNREFDDPDFLVRLRQGEQDAYRLLVRRLHGSLVGVAAAIIGSRAQAEEVVQDAWLAVFAGIGRFEGRSSLTTWLFSIVLNRARTRASREGRLTALPALEGGEPGERAVPRSAFQPDGHWVEPPRLWDELNPERIIGGRQLWEYVQQSIERLPAGQRAVLILRDIEGCAAEDACALLEISPENQRVLLHRARGRIRAAVDALPGMRAAPAAALAPRAASRQGRPTALHRSLALVRQVRACWLVGFRRNGLA